MTYFPGLPGDLTHRLLSQLADYDEFETDSNLRNVFIDELLMPWRAKLRQADNPRDRADKLINYLRDKRRSDLPTSALVLFLVVLRDRTTDRADARYDELDQIAKEVASVLHPNTTPGQADVVNQAYTGTQQVMFTGEWLKLLESINAVGQVKVPQVIGDRWTEAVPSGTGWLIAPTLALTCWHVLEARDVMDRPLRSADLEVQVRNSVLTFDYQLPSSGVEYGIQKLEASDPQLDYALLRLQDRSDCPLAQRGFLKLDLEMPLTIQTRLYVIQHPKGQPQQSSSGCFVQYKEGQHEQVLMHSAPTENGTSGAPVVNVTNWRATALHVAQNRQLALREATRLKFIMLHIQQTQSRIHQEIMNAQTK